MNEDIKVTDIEDDTATDIEDLDSENPAKPENDTEADTLCADLETDESIELLNLELQESKNRIMRLQADFTNFRRRVQKEKEDLVLNANLELIRSLLPVMDSLEKGQQQGDEGAIQIFKQLFEILKREGLVAISAMDQPFDPNFHQAIDQVDCEEKSGTVVEELQKGYTFNGVLIRPSMVRVAK